MRTASEMTVEQRIDILFDCAKKRQVMRLDLTYRGHKLDVQLNGISHEDGSGYRFVVCGYAVPSGERIAFFVDASTGYWKPLDPEGI